MASFSSIKIPPRIEFLQNIISKNNLPHYHVKSLERAIYASDITKYSELTSLPKKVRDEIIQTNGDKMMCIEPEKTSNSSQCQKILFALKDGQSIETVWMKFRKSHTSVCISSQVGCALKCSFCATGAMGFKRQLTVDEITDQVLYFNKVNLPVNTVSFMGMGEALMNPRVFDAISLMTHKKYMAMSPRRINVSTVGIIPGIERITREFPQVNLAFSLHSPFEDQRSELVPTNKTYPLKEVLKSLQQHVARTRKKVLLAYLVLPGFNSSPDHARAILDIINQFPSDIRHLFHLNLIRYNPSDSVGEPFQRTTKAELEKFINCLGNNIPITIRQSFGLDIDAACGQLHHLSQKTLKNYSLKQLAYA